MEYDTAPPAWPIAAGHLQSSLDGAVDPVPVPFPLGTARALRSFARFAGVKNHMRLTPVRGQLVKRPGGQL